MITKSENKFRELAPKHFESNRGIRRIVVCKLRSMMADRLTQLQDAINLQAENLCNSIGILQQYAPPGKLSGLERGGVTPPAQEDFAQLFASLIARAAKDIDVLIESLPNEDSSAELQVQSLRKLEADNQDAADRLEQVVKRGERLLEQIQTALADIAQSQLDMERAQTTVTPSTSWNDT